MQNDSGCVITESRLSDVLCNHSTIRYYRHSSERPIHSQGKPLNETKNIIQQLEHQRNAIDRAISALREVEGTSASTQTASSPAARKGRRKGGISAEGRARIAEATRRR